MREGFLYIYASTKFGIELETMSLTIPDGLPDKQPNQTENRIGIYTAC